MAFKKDQDLPETIFGLSEGLCPISGLPESIYSGPKQDDPFATIREQVEGLRLTIKRMRENYHNQRLRAIADGDYRGERFLAYSEDQTIHPMKQSFIICSATCLRLLSLDLMGFLNGIKCKLIRLMMVVKCCASCVRLWNYD